MGVFFYKTFLKDHATLLGMRVIFKESCQGTKLRYFYGTPLTPINELAANSAWHRFIAVVPCECGPTMKDGVLTKQDTHILPPEYT